MDAFTGISRRNTTLILRNMTGRLFKSFNPQTALNLDDCSTSINLTGYVIGGVIGSKVPYAAIHNYGGIITPKNAKRLSWIGDDGKRIFAKKVIIPKRPYFDNAIAKFRIKIVSIFKNYLENRFNVALAHYIAKGEVGLVQVFAKEIFNVSIDMKVKIPVWAQMFIGAEMKLQNVNKDWKGAG